MSAVDDRTGTTLGPYAIAELLGRGGMGQVYRATDTRKGRTVALKLLNPEFADDQVFRDRFLRESRVAARINDPHVVPIHDWGEIDGLLFIDMRLVTGRDLRAILVEQGSLAPERAVAILGQVADALDAAHLDGLVHRDVKPDNVLVDARDFTYLADFGLAQGTADTRLTTAGTAIGSFGYMAPERFGADEVGAAGDIYALACVLYECIAGTQPFASATNLERLIAAHLNAEPPRTGTALDPVIARGMAKNPRDRYPSAGALIDAARTALASPGEASPGAPFPGTSAAPATLAPHTAPPTGHTTERPAAMNPAVVNPASYSPTEIAAGSGARHFEPYPYAPQHHPQTPTRRSPILAILVAIAVLLAGGIGVGAWVLLRDSDDGARTVADASLTTTPTTAAHPNTASQATPTPTTPSVTTPSPAGSARAAFDLGLATPISTPACDGTGIVVVGNAVDPSNYAGEVQGYLTAFPGSSYLRTDQSCSSLRARDDNGNPIYAVYQVAGRTTADICRLRNQIGGTAYGKWLDNTTDPTTFITPSECGA
ncbi:serine/threonine-protein kinase PknD [Gordonia polyisoprenivorans VH2]|uniref:non-specific serine/threonine protein kinase n=1 Tax=Gordonia polyisoprenivorans (strain DSM 44266 / VH2) TaxID=1112204 RepID=H6MTL2_GORPV|nr:MULTISPECIES: serine/threonine-protein kinase [Gordonia]AFA73887.1 serine/threonine-protein kinase PknD [Gordonia polyisoprenivorans VH2]MDF3280320.1 protein kinase [Gordonia sp. N1V]